MLWSVFIFCLSCYLKLVFPPMLHLEHFSSCGQFLGRQMWQWLVLENALKVVLIRASASFWEKVSTRHIKQHDEDHPRDREMISISFAEVKLLGYHSLAELTGHTAFVCIWMSEWKGWNIRKCPSVCGCVFESVNKTQSVKQRLKWRRHCGQHQDS